MRLVYPPEETRSTNDRTLSDRETGPPAVPRDREQATMFGQPEGADQPRTSMRASDLIHFKHPDLDSYLVLIATAIGLALCGYAVVYTIWLAP